MKLYKYETSNDENGLFNLEVHAHFFILFVGLSTGIKYLLKRWYEIYDTFCEEQIGLHFFFSCQNTIFFFAERRDKSRRQNRYVIKGWNHIIGLGRYHVRDKSYVFKRYSNLFGQIYLKHYQRLCFKVTDCAIRILFYDSVVGKVTNAIYNANFSKFQQFWCPCFTILI